MMRIAQTEWRIMSLKEMVLDKNLPTDEDVLEKLQRAKHSGIKPATHIGSLLESAYTEGKEEFPFIIKRYPKTLAWLCQPENIDWFISDLERTLKYLRDMSKWMNTNQ